MDHGKREEVKRRQRLKSVVRNHRNQRRRRMIQFHQSKLKTLYEIWQTINKELRNRPNNNDDVRRPSSLFECKIRVPSLEERGDEHIPAQNKVNEWLHTTRSTGEDWTSAQYSTGEDYTPPDKKDDEQISSVRKSSKGWIPPRRTQVSCRKLPKHMYNDVYTFEDTYGVTLLTKKEYKAAISFVLTVSHIRPITSVFSTGNGPNLLQEDLIKLNWLPSIGTFDSPRLNSVTSQRVEVNGKITLHVWIGESRIRVSSGIVRNLAVSVLLDTSFVYKFIKRISPFDSKIVSSNSPPRPIFTVHKVETDEEED